MLYLLFSTGDSYKRTCSIVPFKFYDMSRKTVVVNEFVKAFRQYCHPHNFFVINGLWKGIIENAYHVFAVVKCKKFPESGHSSNSSDCAGGSEDQAVGMFVLVEMVDTVRIPPWDFQRQLNEAIAEELNKKLANKVCILMQKVIY